MGSISGGSKDEFAPKVIRQEPEQGAKSVFPKQFKITFDEWVKLNSPEKTITINPSLGTFKTTLQKKNVVIEWGQSPLPNTTYTIQFQNTIKDVNEGNDSIMTFAFSTGETIDSLSCKGRVVQIAEQNQKSNYLIGLYSVDSIVWLSKPSYLTKTTDKGEFQLDYLPLNSFQLIAFDDVNKNNRFDSTESVAFQNNAFMTSDTNAQKLIISPSKYINKTVNFSIEGPGVARISGASDLSKFLLNNSSIFILQELGKDSLRIALPQTYSIPFLLTSEKDTIRKQPKNSDISTIKGLEFSLNACKGDSLIYIFNETFKEIDTSKINVIKNDSLSCSFELKVSQNRIVVFPKYDDPISKINLNVLPSALKGFHAINKDTLKFTSTIRSKEDLSILNLKLDSLPLPLIVELIQPQTKFRKEFYLENEKFIKITNLLPGNYSVIVSSDENKNKVWDTNDILLKKQAEPKYYFSIKQGLRANWEVTEELIPRNKNGNK